MSATREQYLALARKFIEAWKTWTPESMLSFRTPDCTHEVFPSTLGVPVMSYNDYRKFMIFGSSIVFPPWTIEYDEDRTVVDHEKRKMVMYAKSSARNILREHRQEYIMVRFPAAHPGNP
jgi:hypothetical protein